MSTTDYRAMCAELVDAYAWCIEAFMTAPAEEDTLIQRARALLAQPEPEGPTEEELRRVFVTNGAWPGGLRAIADLAADRARQGRPAPQPVAVGERLPGPGDCDEQGRCWMFGNVEGDWRLISMINPGVPKLKYCFSHWLPANALPTPEATHD